MIKMNFDDFTSKRKVVIECLRVYCVFFSVVLIGLYNKTISIIVRN